MKPSNPRLHKHGAEFHEESESPNAKKKYDGETEYP
jgi:hypothetical protein